MLTADSATPPAQSATSYILARDPEGGQLGSEALKVIDPDIERRDPEARPSDWRAEVEANTTSWTASERHIAVPEAAADADGGDPAPGSLDAPAGDVADRRAEPPPTEACGNLAIDVGSQVKPKRLGDISTKRRCAE